MVKATSWTADLASTRERPETIPEAEAKAKPIRVRVRDRAAGLDVEVGVELEMGVGGPAVLGRDKGREES